MIGPADLHLEHVGGVPVARLEGEIDLSNAERIEWVILESVLDPDPRLVVDLTEVRYVDSAGIRALFDLSRRLSRHQRELVLVVAEEAVIRRALEIGGIFGAMPVAPTVEQATTGGVGG